MSTWWRFRGLLEDMLGREGKRDRERERERERRRESESDRERERDSKDCGVEM